MAAVTDGAVVTVMIEILYSTLVSPDRKEEHPPMSTPNTLTTSPRPGLHRTSISTEEIRTRIAALFADRHSTGATDTAPASAR
ncbi:hypothetical protein ACFVKB_47660 [Rhodococcus sp. NPDC127530]|uniref:hypothetical protein n=1 Tax=unclassified Rhodococcus (in: high G+C Gram-positive bacteria) TaxID=192944 RepID=UPI0036339ED8